MNINCSHCRRPKGHPVPQDNRSLGPLSRRTHVPKDPIFRVPKDSLHLPQEPTTSERTTRYIPTDTTIPKDQNDPNASTIPKDQ